MANNNNMLQLCRLCLVKDDVNIPIFEEQGDIRQIFLKISSCLPVKVSREDRLPKKICDGCSYKLDMLYEFWNTSANAEKQLLSWLGEAGVSSKMADGAISAVAQQMRPAEVKEETLEPDHLHNVDEDDKDYLFEQQRVVEAAAAAGPSATVTSNDEEEPPPKRARRTAAVKAAIAMDQDSDDDDDSGEPLTKIEDESDDSEGEDHVPAFVDVPSTSADDQPGPSGVGKEGVEAPLFIDPSMIKEEHNNDVERQEVRSTTVSRWCAICETKFFNEVKYALHTFSHSKNGIFKCFLCPLVEKSTEDRVEQHIRRHLNQSVAKCHFCPETKFYSMKHYTEHRNVHTGIKPFGCSYCELAFVFSASLKLHLELKHHDVILEEKRRKADEERSSRLREEAKMKKERDYLEMRKRWEETRRDMPPPVPSKDPIFCEKCKATFNNKVDYAVHLMKHSEDGVFECFLCDSTKKRSLHDIEKHIRLHEGTYVADTAAKIYQCEICGTKFEKANKLQNHIKCHDSDRETYDCTLCDKKYLKKISLLNHNAIHHDGPHTTSTTVRECEICGKKLLYSKTYKLHMALHNGVRPYKCTFCDKAFPREAARKEHERVHTGERPFSCKFCSMSFSQLTTRKLHERLHTGEKPYKCDGCGKGFISNSAKNCHLKKCDELDSKLE